jgi:hypothetical protein
LHIVATLFVQKKCAKSVQKVFQKKCAKKCAKIVPKKQHIFFHKKSAATLACGGLIMQLMLRVWAVFDV